MVQLLGDTIRLWNNSAVNPRNGQSHGISQKLIQEMGEVME
ncbi:hypothetical protein [Mammaliicoccus stepanovicii]|nr:hypothetical protein [Mammaliicoccus stepanovicii]